jgi:hypothetical protein
MAAFLSDVTGMASPAGCQAVAIPDRARHVNITRVILWE